MEVLEAAQWRPRAEAHAARVEAFVRPHLARREDRVAHPVHDFLFTYYSQRPAQLRRWHPGRGTVLVDAPEHAGWRGYEVVSTGSTSEGRGRTSERRGVTVPDAHVAAQRPLLESLHALLSATAARPPSFGCFGLHEWAMVYRTQRPRHADWPLRLGPHGTDEVVEGHRIACSHFDAFRFFTPAARPLNTLGPTSADRVAFEQPGCLHAGMDLYKHAFRLTPMVCSELVADCFELARDIRELDMRASPYDLRDLGFAPVRIETAGGKQEYAAAQRRFAERGAPLRQRLVAECERLLAAVARLGEDSGPAPH